MGDKVSAAIAPRMSKTHRATTTGSPGSKTGSADTGRVHPHSANQRIRLQKPRLCVDSCND